VVDQVRHSLLLEANPQVAHLVQLGLCQLAGDLQAAQRGLADRRWPAARLQAAEAQRPEAVNLPVDPPMSQGRRQVLVAQPEVQRVPEASRMREAQFQRVDHPIPEGQRLLLVAQPEAQRTRAEFRIIRLDNWEMLHSLRLHPRKSRDCRWA